jgi:hypothetical protein
MVKIWESIFGHQIKPEGPEKPIDQGQVHYLGGHKAYPQPIYSQIYFYEDRIELQVYRLKIYFKSIKNVENVNEKKRDSEYLAAGLLLPPVVLGYLWKKNHIYSVIELTHILGIKF